MKRRGNKKGQGMVEFMMMFAAALFFFTIFMSIVQMNIMSKNEEKQMAVLQNVAFSVKNEVKFAAESSDGYSREFTVPENILGLEYEIQLVEDMVFVKMGEQTFSYDIVSVIGSIQKGKNVIRKKDGAVEIN